MRYVRFVTAARAALLLALFTTTGMVQGQSGGSALADTAFLAATTLDRQLGESANRRVPDELRLEARCVAVFPSVVKAGLIIASKQGNGLVACRQASGGWGSPAYYSIAATSVGIQAGIQSASYIMLFLDDESVDSLFDEQASLGSDISIAAGPVGAAGNYADQPSIVSYVRTAGLFAGVNLEGANISFVTDANRQLFATGASARSILLDDTEVPMSLEPFHAALNRFSPTP